MIGTHRVPNYHQSFTNKSYTISLKLENYCPWYNIKGEVPGRILCPIVFDATVEDWQDGGDIYLSAD